MLAIAYVSHIDYDDNRTRFLFHTPVTGETPEECYDDAFRIAQSMGWEKGDLNCTIEVIKE